MSGPWTVLLSLFIIALQLIALGRTYQQTRLMQRFRQYRWMRRGWLAIMAGVVLMVGRRITALLLTYQSPWPSDWLAWLDRYVIPGSISVLLWLGIEGVAYGIRQLLRSK